MTRGDGDGGMEMKGGLEWKRGKGSEEEEEEEKEMGGTEELT